jgi:hypothetical protein
MKKDDLAAWVNSTGFGRVVNFFVGPVGSLKASIALHLHCSSYHVADPWDEKCFERSSPSIQQLQSMGLNPENALFFDHLSRREAHRFGAKCGIKRYPKDVLAVHEAFMLSVRKKAAAAVEICFGKPVYDRMKSLFKLEPFPLWGEYQGVTLWLEWNYTAKNRSLEHIILFAMHPNALVYVDRNGPQLRIQELTLRAGAKLAGIVIPENICFKDLCRLQNFKLSKSETALKTELNTMAMQEFIEIGILRTQQAASKRVKALSAEVSPITSKSPAMLLDVQSTNAEIYDDPYKRKRKCSEGIALGTFQEPEISTTDSFAAADAKENNSMTSIEVEHKVGDRYVFFPYFYTNAHRWS